MGCTGAALVRLGAVAKEDYPTQVFVGLSRFVLTETGAAPLGKRPVCSGSGKLPQHLPDDVDVVGRGSIGGIGGDEPELRKPGLVHRLDALDDEASAVPEHEQLAGSGDAPRGVDHDPVAFAHLGLHGVAAHLEDPQVSGVGADLVADHDLGQALEALLGPKTAATVLGNLSKELELKGMLHVLRHSFKCYGKAFPMAYFRPNTTMNPEAAENYARNRLAITRQVAFTSVMKKADGKNRRCIIDVTLAVNGIPVVTAKLKNPLTGQRAADAKRQYEDERDERDPLFAFKKRALVHFAVDPDEVWMTTRLRGKETHFLPFNRGNPPVEENWKTHYLWDEVLLADSRLEILQRFMHLEVKEKQVKTDKGVCTVRKETMVFPRHHQLDSVRKLVAHAKSNGAGRNYLIQHSAGSGKSNSIAWLAHRLASLHDKHDEKVFHSVIVVTDRRVLDQQLQSTIYQFEHKTGVVEKIDEDTPQLARALSQATPIVITTIQKFPFISQALSTLEKKGSGVKIDTAGQRFAVIVDETHSSQSGETATALKGMLNREGIWAAIAAQLSEKEDDDLSDDAKAAVLRDALQRSRQPNLSFFAFTATPKFKTKALFDEPGPSGASPFHGYSMRQAIEEGFVMDVLQNYTTYKRFFGLIKQVEDDPDVPRKKAAKVLTRYLELHPANIEQVVSVIVEHFRVNVMHELGGRAKAMVVTGSRLAAVKYKLTFDRYIKEQGYTGKSKATPASVRWWPSRAPSRTRTCPDRPIPKWG